MPQFDAYPASAGLTADDLLLALNDPAGAKAIQKVTVAVALAYFGARANHSGTQPASSISDLASTITGAAVGGQLSGTIGSAQIAAGLDALNDVAVTSPAAGHILRHNGTQFVNQPDDIYPSVQSATVTVTVGTGGTYPTISAALTALSKKHASFVNGGFTATISLLAGFVMSEQITLQNCDFGWVEITSVDAEVTVTRSTIPSGQGAWYALRNAVLPRISCFFRMDASGAGTAHRVFDIQHNSHIEFGSTGGGGGAVNRVLQVIHNSTCVATSGVLIKDALDIGVRVANASFVSIPFSTITNNTNNGIAVSSGAIVQATGSTVTGHVVNVAVTGGAIVSIPTSTLTGAGAGEAVNVSGAMCDVTSSNLTGGGALATFGANVVAYGCVLGVGDSLRVLQGGVIHATGRTGSGTLTQTANLWTRDGVIWDDAAPSGGDALLAANGSAGAPSHSFAADTDTGMYRTSGGLLAFAHNGVARAFLDGAAGLDLDVPLLRTKNGVGVGNIVVGGRSTDGRAEFAFQNNAFNANNARLVATTNALTIEAAGIVRVGLDATGLGFYGVTPVARPSATADIKDALTALGLLQGTSATPLNLDGGTLTAGVTVETAARTAFSNANTTATAASRVLAQTGTLTAARVVTLPAASSVPGGTALQVVDESGTATASNTLSWARAGADTINGAAGNVVAVNAGYGSGLIVSDGTSKWITVNTGAGTAVGGDLTGTVANAQIAANSVGVAELAAAARTIAPMIAWRHGTLAAEAPVLSVTVRWYNRHGRTITVTAVHGAVDTAPTGSAVSVAVRKNSNTVNDASFLINAGAHTGSATGLNISVADGDYLQAWVAAAGTGQPGTDLTVFAVGN